MHSKCSYVTGEVLRTEITRSCNVIQIVIAFGFVIVRCIVIHLSTLAALEYVRIYGDAMKHSSPVADTKDEINGKKTTQQIIKKSRGRD